MPDISQVIDVQISAPRAGISRQGFGVPLIVTPAVAFAGRTRTYTTLGAAQADFPAGTPAGDALARVFGQNPQVRRVIVGRRQVDEAVVTVESAAIGSVHRLTVEGVSIRKGVAKIIFDADLVTSNTINGKVNGVSISQVTYASSHADTMAAIATAIETALAGVGVTAVATVGGVSNRTITVVAENAGLIPTDWVVAAGAGQAGVTHALTEANVATVLAAAINASDAGDTVTANASGDDVELEVDEAGTGWSVTIQTSNLSLGDLTTVAPIATDLAAIRESNNDWYLAILTDRDPADAAAAAAFISAYEKMLFVASEEADVVGQDAETDTTSLPAVLKAAGYSNVAVFWHEDVDSFLDAAVAGKILPFNPGGYTTAYKEIVFPAGPSHLTDTQSLNARSKNANLLEGFDVPRVWKGVMANGTQIDRIHGRHKLFARLREYVFAGITAPPKVPFTAAGIAVVEQGMRRALDEALRDGFLQSYTLQMPDPADISPQDREERVLRDCNSIAQEAGAIEAVEIRVAIQL